MQVNITIDRNVLLAVAGVLKKRFPNLTVAETLTISYDIADEVEKSMLELLEKIDKK